MEHPSAPLQALLQPIQQLYDEVRAKAVARLAIEKMEQDAKLITPGSQFYGKAEAYALASFAYYNCFKCRKFYFGGRRDCEQNAAAEVRPEEEFVCYDCADLKATACKKDSHQSAHTATLNAAPVLAGILWSVVLVLMVACASAPPMLFCAVLQGVSGQMQCTRMVAREE